MSAVTLERIQQEELVKLFGRMLGVRLVFLPAVLILLGYIAWVDGYGARFLTVLVLLLGAGSFFTYELLVYRRVGFRPGALGMNVSAIVVAQLTLTAVTGGIASPIVVAAVPIAILNGIFVKGPVGVALSFIQASAFWVMAALDWDVRNASLAFILSFFAGAARLLGGVLRNTFLSMIGRGLDAERATLTSYNERRAELLALSSELAHELKNPLASIKGLAALLAESTAPGKPAERLSVLRGEVDRMQATLDGFLNFSRPLVPMVNTRVALQELTADVIRMHEGLARERHVTLIASGAGEAVCDARKVKQIVVNLVQNALEASPVHGQIVIAIADGGAQVEIAVHDEGSGVTAELLPRIFDAGVTSKTTGSGLGLTISRALARQHDGELTLHPRSPRGMTALLALPKERP